MRQNKKKKYTYPIITLNNFDAEAKKYIGNRREWNRSWKSWEIFKLLKVRAPRTRNEFFEMTRNMFGEGLELASYHEIKHSDLYDTPLFKLWDKLGGSRLIGETLWQSDMHTGGWYYGSPNPGYRSRKRLQKLLSTKLSSAYTKSLNQT